jgi:3-methyl-2-oxobutanoate hydroxymethyltransferase
VKPYADVGGILLDAARRFGAEVRGGEYPDAEHSYS